MSERTKGWLRSPDLLAKKPLIGWIMFIVGIVVFTLLANWSSGQRPIDKKWTPQFTNACIDTRIEYFQGSAEFYQARLTLVMREWWSSAALWVVFIIRPLLEGNLEWCCWQYRRPVIFLAISHISPPPSGVRGPDWDHIDRSRVSQRACCHAVTLYGPARLPFYFRRYLSRSGNWVVMY